MGYYPVQAASYNYFGASGYDEKSDIRLSIVQDSTSTSNPGCYYLEYALVDKSKINAPLSEFVISS